MNKKYISQLLGILLFISGGVILVEVLYESIQADAVISKLKNDWEQALKEKDWVKLNELPWSIRWYESSLFHFKSFEGSIWTYLSPDPILILLFTIGSTFILYGVLEKRKEEKRLEDWTDRCMWCGKVIRNDE